MDEVRAAESILAASAAGNGETRYELEWPGESFASVVLSMDSCFAKGEMFLRLAQSTAPQASCAPALARWRTHWPPLIFGFHGKTCGWDELRRARTTTGKAMTSAAIARRRAEMGQQRRTSRPLPWQFVNQQPNDQQHPE